jgi:predicted phage tail protein
MLVGAGACLSTEPAAHPVTVSVEASQTTAAPNDSIRFVVKAEGDALLAVQADYGDGTGVDSYGTSGARTASVTFRHAYLAAGTYTVTATAIDAFAAQKTATVQIRVN